MQKEINYLRPGEIETGGFKKAIFSIGAVEGHGPHLPTGTDTLIAEGITADIAACFDDMLVLPPINYGVSANHMMFPYTISLEPETLISILDDILDSLYKRGIYRVIIINGHNGNTAPIEIAGRRAHQRHRELKVVSMPAWWLCTERLLEPHILSEENGWHAGEMETSLAMALFPQHIDLSQAQDSPPRIPYSPLFDIKYTIDELTHNGSVGRPTRATAEKGTAIRKALQAEAISFIRKLDNMDWNYSITL